MKKTWFGVTLMGLGILIGLAVGIGFCLIGGIVQIIHTLQSPDGINAWAIAVGITRILCAGICGWLSALLLVIPGYVLLTD